MKNPAKLVVTLTLTVVALALPYGFSDAASLALDQGFRTGVFSEPHPAERTLLLPDGKFLLFYNTDTLTDQPTGAVTRYLSNGALDTSFHFSRDYKLVAAAASVANGKLVIAATRYTYGSPTKEILRLNSDGTIDASFNAAVVGSDPYSDFLTVVEQPDGKILVSGSLNTFNGVAAQRIVRLLADGALDSSFTPPNFGGQYGYAINATPVVLPDGKILVAGNFTTVNGAASLGLARLNPDGSLDSSFQPSGFVRTGSTTPIRGLAVQNDGKILLGGVFRVGSGTFAPRPALIRLNPDGSLDSGYMFVDASGRWSARNLLLQPDGKAITVIAYVDSGGFLQYFLSRFEANGPQDGSFTPPQLVAGPHDTLGTLLTLNLQPDGRIIVGGIFTNVYPAELPDGAHFGVIRLNSDGTVDPTLVTTHKTGRQNFPSSFARLSDGSALVAFGIPFIKNEPAMSFNLGRLRPNGSVDPSFSLLSSNPDSVLAHEFSAQNLVELADGRFLIFSDYGVAKFLPNGVEDLAFQADPYLPPFQEAKAAPDGKVFLSAGTDPQATVTSSIARLQTNGTADSSFGIPASVTSGQIIRNQQTGSLDKVFAGSHLLAVQPDGKTLFLYLSSDALYHFVRLNGDGSVDSNFSGATLNPIDLFVYYPVVFDPYQSTTLMPALGVASATVPLQDARVLGDGRILICGQFNSYNGVPARGLVRLQSDGTLDSTFPTGGGAQWTQTVETPSYFPFVESIEEQVDGKLLIAGTFEAFNGTPLPGIASLNPNGSVDLAFTPPVKRQKFVRGPTRLARQADGSFLLSGPYSFPNETEPRLIHINSVGGIPVVGSPALATASVGEPFSYQIVASGQPTSYSASGLPSGFSLNSSTGLIIGVPTSANAGVYQIMVTATNTEGTSIVFTVTLTITPSQTTTLGRLRNISTRLRVQTGDNVLIGGFIVTGSAPRKVILRAIGPSLANAGVSGALADPVLELHGSGTFATITNDNWRDTQQSEIEATGLSPSNELESAIVVTLSPGPYTAIVRGAGNGTGVALVETYDLDSTASAQLANISTRGFVDTGDNVMIGGFITGPSVAGSNYILVRALGPSLAGLGVPNPLQDPMLELHDGYGTLIASNHDWRDNQQAAIEATGVTPRSEDEAAILTVLAPGNYTVIVRGENNSVGVGLVEVYNLQ